MTTPNPPPLDEGTKLILAMIEDMRSEFKEGLDALKTQIELLNKLSFIEQFVIQQQEAILRTAGEIRKQKDRQKEEIKAK